LLFCLLCLFFILGWLVSSPFYSWKNFEASTPDPRFTPHCFTPFFFKAPCKFTPLLILRSLTVSLTPYGWLRYITLTPYFW
jgi:hypothetical protein